LYWVANVTQLSLSLLALGASFHITLQQIVRTFTKMFFMKLLNNFTLVMARFTYSILLSVIFLLLSSSFTLWFYLFLIANY